MKRHTFEHNGFHGRHDLSIMIPDTAEPGDTIRVSPAVAKRLNSAVCGAESCQCGEHVAEDGGFGVWTMIVPDTDHAGKYPQFA